MSRSHCKLHSLCNWNCFSAKPYEDYWDSPVYDMTTDDDGNLNNPGDILFYKKTRTGQKDNYNISVGFSATWSTPQDKKAAGTM